MGRDRQVSHSRFRPGLRPWVSAAPESSRAMRQLRHVLGSVLRILNPRRRPCFNFHPSRRSWGSTRVRAIAGSVWAAGLSERYGFNLNLDGSGPMRHTTSSPGRHPPNLRRVSGPCRYLRARNIDAGHLSSTRHLRIPQPRLEGAWNMKFSIKLLRCRLGDAVIVQYSKIKK